MLKIQGVTKKFQEQIVLSDIHLSIEDGSIFGLIGPNGSGKSTLLKIIAGILKPELGCIEVDEMNIYDIPEMKQNIFILSDDPYYFMNASIKDMKEFYKCWYPSFDEERYKKYITIFHLDELKQMKNFSKGMKRQAFIAIALAIAPRYLLLDEAFDGLDPIMRHVFKQAIAELLEDSKMTIIISSHNLRELEDICDSYGILENCQINTAGNIEVDKRHIHKIQLAFSQEMNKTDFDSLDILSLNIQSRIVSMVVKGDMEVIHKTLDALHPLMKEVLDVNLEELFIYEMKQKGYGLYEK